MHPLALNDEIENNYYKLIVFTMQNTPAVEVQNWKRTHSAESF